MRKVSAFSRFAFLYSCAFVLICVFFWPVHVSGDEICRVMVNCPSSANTVGDTVRVPDNVVMLSEILEHCSPDSVIEPSVGDTDTISLFFVIDHSASMSEYDPKGIRYTIARHIIDSLARHSPASEIGLAVFSNKLLHNYQDDSFFEQLDDSQGWNDSYVPLTRLDAQVGGMSAVDKLKWAIETSTTEKDMGLNWKLTNGNYDNSGRGMGYYGTTDVSLGFEAAQKAFLSATYRKSRQYIIFFSDGIAQKVDEQRQQYMNDYIEGKDVPTTFTAFFLKKGMHIPAQITQMTDNIRQNGYSAKNPFSTIWRHESEMDSVVSKLLDIIIGNGLKIIRSTPKQMTINTVTTTTFDSLYAFFPCPLVPFTGPSTTVTASLTFTWDYPISKDSTETHTFVVQHSNNPGPDSLICWEQGSLGFYDHGKPIWAAGPQQTAVEVRFFPPPDPPYPYPVGSCNLIITNAAGTDSLLVTAAANGAYFTATFLREYSDIALIDNILQNTSTDSIKAIYRNPDIPLDIVRHAITVLPELNLTVTNAYYKDQNANGYPDLVRLTIADGDVLTQQDCDRIKPYIAFQTPRAIGSIVSLLPSTQGLDITIEEPSDTQSPFTGVYPEERITIGSVPNLTSGNTFPQTSAAIRDSMAPVIVGAKYFDKGDSAQHDTLHVTFSESVNPTSSPRPFVFVRPEGNLSYTLSMSLAKKDTTTMIFAVDPSAPVIFPRKGDSIYIDVKACISDICGAVQNNPLNIRRLLTYYLVYTIDHAAYFDTTAVSDGLIDQIRVYTDRIPDEAMISALYQTQTTPPHRSFTTHTITPASFGFIIHVGQSPITVPCTGVDPLRDILMIDKTISETNGIIHTAEFAIHDSIAPVIVQSVFYPAIKETNASTIPDTLLATLSEVIKKPFSDKPFVFKDKVNSGTYFMTLDGTNAPAEAGAYRFIVLSKEKEFPQKGDSTWINSQAAVVDCIGNVQKNVHNRHVPLNVRPYTFFTTVCGAPNPWNPLHPVSNPFTSEQGFIVLAKLIGSLPPFVTISGYLDIIDAAGNRIVERKQGIMIPDKKSLVFIWNGTNKQNRIIGDGTYVGFVSIQSSEGQKERQRILIGVKKNNGKSLFDSFSD